MARPENEFPTIKDLRDCLENLIVRGFGELPVQIVIVPDSTIRALAGEPATMIEYSRDGHSLGVSFISTDRLDGAAAGVSH